MTKRDNIYGIVTKIYLRAKKSDKSESVVGLKLAVGEESLNLGLLTMRVRREVDLVTRGKRRRRGAQRVLRAQHNVPTAVNVSYTQTTS